MQSSSNTRLSLPVIDLFAGIGGLSLGACRAGFDLRLAVESDRHACAAHKRNFFAASDSDADICSLSGVRLLQLAGVRMGELCGLIGGPPCQGFSSIGRRNVDDPRNALFRRFFQLAKETRPKFFLAENVPGILQDRYRSLRSSALNLVRDEYVLLDPFEVSAAEYGAPTTRSRVIFFGYLGSVFPSGFTRADFDPPRGTVKVTVRDALRGLPSRIRDEWATESKGWRVVRNWPMGPYGDKIKGHRPPGIGDREAILMLKRHRVSGCVSTLHTAEVRRRFASLSFGERDGVSRASRLDPDGFCPTLRAGTDRDHGSYQAVRPIHPVEARVITPREAARLQGFPDWFQFAPTKWHGFRQIGNSVSPILAEALLNVVSARLGKSRTSLYSQRAA